MNIVLFGGTFDPIHSAHILMAKKAKEKYQAKVIFIPNKNSPWKGITTNPNDKKEMVRLAISNIDGFECSSYELEKDTNYTIDTVKHFKEMYPNDNLYLLIGSDQANLFYKWKDSLEIIKYVKIICYKRKDVPIDQKMIDTYHIEILEGKEMESASTDIRDLIAADTDIKVLDYIQKHNLYYMPKIASYIDERRLRHSCSVALLSYQIAISNNIDRPYRAYIAGLLHDIGKKVDEKTLKEIEEEYKAYLPMNPKVYHQFLSKRIAMKDFKINDPEILEAIEFHATGKDRMNTLGKIVYASDKIDPLRGYDSKWMIDACLKNIDNGFVVVLSENKKYLDEAHKDCGNILTSSCFKYYL